MDLLQHYVALQNAIDEESPTYHTARAAFEHFPMTLSMAELLRLWFDMHTHGYRGTGSLLSHIHVRTHHNSGLIERIQRGQTRINAQARRALCDLNEYLDFMADPVHYREWMTDGYNARRIHLADQRARRDYLQACIDEEDRATAVMSALHRRLGADARLSTLPPDVLRNFIFDK
jgi:hypothetical protein